jgi:hypothetical protein
MRHRPSRHHASTDLEVKTQRIWHNGPSLVGEQRDLNLDCPARRDSDAESRATPAPTNLLSIVRDGLSFSCRRHPSAMRSRAQRDHPARRILLHFSAQVEAA